MADRRTTRGPVLRRGAGSKSRRWGRRVPCGSGEVLARDQARRTVASAGGAIRPLRRWTRRDPRRRGGVRRPGGEQLRPGGSSPLPPRSVGGPPGDQAELRVGSAHARKSGGAVAVPGDRAGECGLDQAVLTGVVGDDHASPAGSEQGEGVVEGPLELVQLLVHGDADGLEDPAGRVAPGATGGRRDGRPHHVGQLAGRGHGSRRHDGPGDAPGEPPFAVVGEQSDQGVFVELVDDVGGGPSRGRVHPHVEGRVPAIRESPLGHVELRRADAEIEEGPAQSVGQRTDPEAVLDLGHHPGQVVEA